MIFRICNRIFEGGKIASWIFEGVKIASWILPAQEGSMALYLTGQTLAFRCAGLSRTYLLWATLGQELAISGKYCRYGHCKCRFGRECLA